VVGARKIAGKMPALPTEEGHGGAVPLRCSRFDVDGVEVGYKVARFGEGS
jgi:hypothetical protein